MILDLKELRKSIDVSQAMLSELLNISQYRLSGIELKKEKATDLEIKCILDTIEKIKEGQIVPRKKKRISKETFNSSIVDSNPRRYYRKTTRNDEYLNLLSNLEKEFHKENTDAPTAMSFFAGCGGLCYGIKAAGFNIVATNELVEEYKDIYKLNFPNCRFLSNDIKNVSDEEIENILKEYPQIDLFAGGPPCQGFSLAGKRDVGDERNTLFQYYLNIANKVRPKVILMENVKLLTSMRTPQGSLVKDEIISTLEEIGYHSHFFIVNASDYQVAQNRERVLFIAIRSDLLVSPSIPNAICGASSTLFNTLQPKYTFGDAVSDLEYIESGECSTNDIYHKATKHPEHVIRWLYNVPEGKSAHDNSNPALRPPSGFNTTYKRQVWNEPGCTVTTNFNMISGGNNVHPIATRALTVREALRLQSFPDSFKLIGKDGIKRTVIGNAVPPLLAYNIAKHIKETYILSNS